MTRSRTSVVVLAVVASMVITTIAPAAAGASAAAGNVAVTTEGPTGVTGASATLQGNLTDLGNASNATVSFGYWVEGDAANASSAEAGTLNDTGTFDANVTGFVENTTYVVVARANASDGSIAEGEEVTFSTGVDDGDDAFGQSVSTFVHELLGLELDGPLGWYVSEWVVTNNPGADNRPDHAGPDGDRGPPDHVGGPWGASDEADGENDDERGPPDHANNGDDESEDEGDDDNDEAQDDGERGPPDHANGHGNGSN